jgi:methylisocitrate lyase
VGRTDARAPLGLDEAIRRARLYRDAGADILFVEAPQSREELARIGKEAPGPLMANLVEGGQTPLLAPSELEAMGFEWAVWPLTGLLAAAHALDAAYRALRETGTSASRAGTLMSFDELTRLVGLEAKYALEERFRA